MRRSTRVLLAIPCVFAAACANSGAEDVGDTIGSYFTMDAGAVGATGGGTTGGTAGNPANTGGTGGSSTGGSGAATGGSSGAASTGGAGATTGTTGNMMPDDPDASVDPGTTGGNPPPPMPLPAGVLITEIMPRPDGGGNSEWIEIFNGSDTEIDLNGCTVSNGGTLSTSSFTITGSVKVAAKGYAVLARENASTDSGITPTYVYDRLYMDSSETLTFTCAGVMVDSLTFSDAPFKASLQLDERYVNALKNDDLSTWCSGSAALPLGEDLGSPGAANTSCTGVAAP